MLDRAQKPLLTIETRASTPAMQISLRQIEQYLDAQLSRRQQAHSSVHGRRIILDVRTLDLKHAGQGPIGNWQSGDIIYALRLYRSSLLFGPIYTCDTGQGPCPCCLERRWSNVYHAEDQAQGSWQEEFFFLPSIWLTPFALATIWTIVETTLFCSEDGFTNNARNDQMYQLDLASLRLSKQQLLADPSCPLCSSRRKDSPEAAVIRLSSRAKPDILSYHPVKAATCALPISGYINPVCGILGAHVESSEEHTIITSTGGTYFQRNGTKLAPAFWTGYGTTYVESLRHGIFEGLERLAGEKPRAKESVVFGSFQDLQADALDPSVCGISQSKALRPYTPDLQVPWVWGYSFRQSSPMLVPAQCVYYQPDGQATNFIYETSSGCASGFSIEEAVLFGLLELVERDGIMLAWYAKQSPRQIDPRSICDTQTLFMLERMERLGYDIHLLDLRFDGLIPAVLAVAVLREDKLGKLALGGGASFDPNKAIASAVREVGGIIQWLPKHVEDHLDQLQAMSKDYTQVVNLIDHAALYGLPEMAEKASFLYQNPTICSLKEAYQDWEALRPKSLDLRDDVQYGIAEMLRLCTDVIVVEQTSPEQEQVGLKSARVIVPGLLPIAFGWNNIRVLKLPRLRTAPRIAGYRETDFDPCTYNPHPHPFA